MEITFTSILDTAADIKITSLLNDAPLAGLSVSEIEYAVEFSFTEERDERTETAREYARQINAYAHY